MKEIHFQVSGRGFSLTRQQVIDAMKGQTPEGIQTWAVEVEGRLFPVKQVLAAATGLNRTDFISHQARDVLKRLGFYAVNVKNGTPPPTPPTSTAEANEEDHEPDRNRRQSLLELAVLFHQHRPEATVEDVLSTAQAFENWISH